MQERQMKLMQEQQNPTKIIQNFSFFSKFNSSKNETTKSSRQSTLISDEKINQAQKLFKFYQPLDLNKKEFMKNFNSDLKDEQIFRNELLITLKERNKSSKKQITEFSSKKQTSKKPTKVKQKINRKSEQKPPDNSNSQTNENSKFQMPKPKFQMSSNRILIMPRKKIQSLSFSPPLSPRFQQNLTLSQPTQRQFMQLLPAIKCDNLEIQKRPNTQRLFRIKVPIFFDQMISQKKQLKSSLKSTGFCQTKTNHRLLLNWKMQNRSFKNKGNQNDLVVENSNSFIRILVK